MSICLFQRLRILLFLSLFSLKTVAMTRAEDRPDRPLQDFEGRDYAPWTTTGEAFGAGPAEGTLPNQMPVSGFGGRGLASSYHGGDGPTGVLTSPPFLIDRHYLGFLIGGGGFDDQTCLTLKVNGRVVRTATGPNVQPGGSESLDRQAWDVDEFSGKRGQIEAIDRASGGWGHISFDEVTLTDRRPEGLVVRVTRTIPIRERFLLLPIDNNATARTLQVTLDGHPQPPVTIALASGPPQWWATWDVASWRGKSLELSLARVPEGWAALDAIKATDTIPRDPGLYQELLRPQIHFSSQHGWMNDPNGLVYANGLYHLFFQHNPFGWDWGNMHWGHAVSKDLVHWQEWGEALAPDRSGTMFSGSGVVDFGNTSGLRSGAENPLLFFYTSAGESFTQGLAFSNDGGRTLSKFVGNPIVPQITPSNRDPKVLWHEPTRHWVMVVYIERPDEPREEARRAIQFLTSTDAKSWTREGVIEGFFECPDLFELPVEGEPHHAKWVLTAASSEYMLGTFDGRTFRPETPKFPGHRGRGFYAAQTFSDIPATDGRRIQIGWLQAPSPGMSFNQCQSLPLRLTLKPTPDGPRLAREPVRELEGLRADSLRKAPLTLKPGDPNPLRSLRGELLEIRADFEPSRDAQVRCEVRGVTIKYDAETGELSVGDLRAPAPPREGRVTLTIHTDRTSFEVFANGGLTYIPLPILPNPKDLGVSAHCDRGEARFHTLDVHTLRSIWDRPAP